MVSLKTKFTLITSAVILIVVAIYGGVMFWQEQQQKTDEIYRNAYAYAELVSQRVMENFRGNYQTGNFVRFKTTMVEELEKNRDISDIWISDYKGVILYQYGVEKDRVYEGDVRLAEQLQPGLLERVQAVAPSVETESGRVLYVLEENNSVQYADEQGRVLPLEQWVQRGEQVRRIVYPLKGRLDDHRYAVVYDVSYDALTQYFVDRAWQTLLLTLLFIVVGVAVAYFFALRVVSPILRLSSDVLHMAEGKLGTQVDISTNDEVGTLATSFNKMSKDLKTATDALVSRERLAKEVELASKIQQEFLPQSIPLLGDLDVAAGVRPADAVGGDCYDFVPIDDHRMLFFIGDVTGHGVSAGLITAIANSIVYSLAHHDDISTKDIAINLNRVLRAKTRPDMFITMFIGLWDTQTNTVRYTPAGHEPTYHYKAATGELNVLKKEGIALGLLDDISGIMKEDEVTLDPGDTLVFYSDGIPEAWSSDRVMYDFGRFEESIRRYIHAPTAQDIHTGIMKDVYEFMGEAQQQDDITLIVFKRKNTA